MAGRRALPPPRRDGPPPAFEREKDTRPLHLTIYFRPFHRRSFVRSAPPPFAGRVAFAACLALLCKKTTAICFPRRGRGLDCRGTRRAANGARATLQERQWLKRRTSSTHTAHRRILFPGSSCSLSRRRRLPSLLTATATTTTTARSRAFFFTEKIIIIMKLSLLAIACPLLLLAAAGSVRTRAHANKKGAGSSARARADQQ